MAATVLLILLTESAVGSITTVCTRSSIVAHQFMMLRGGTASSLFKLWMLLSYSLCKFGPSPSDLCLAFKHNAIPFTAVFLPCLHCSNNTRLMNANGPEQNYAWNGTERKRNVNFFLSPTVNDSVHAKSGGRWSRSVGLCGERLLTTKTLCTE